MFIVYSATNRMSKELQVKKAYYTRHSLFAIVLLEIDLTVKRKMHKKGEPSRHYY